ncbi:MAG: hypothetical protein WBV33_08650 [Terracidiphilus sp.]
MAESQTVERAAPVQAPVRRPYRFGITFAILNLVAGLFYGFQAVTGGPDESISLAASALLAAGTGVGLLRKKRYGLTLLALGFLVAAGQIIPDWFKPHSGNQAYYVCVNVGASIAALAVIAYFYKRRMEFSSQKSVAAHLSRVHTSEGDLTVMTKAGRMLSSPRTTVMPAHFADLGNLGVRFHWNTNDPGSLAHLHNLLVKTLEEGVTPMELRSVADAGKMLLSAGLPFIPGDAPLPDSLRQVAASVKSVI